MTSGAGPAAQGASRSPWCTACAGRFRGKFDISQSKADEGRAESPRLKEIQMVRFLAGAAACFLLLTGAFLMWQSRAQGPSLPNAPVPRLAGGPLGSPLMAPEASAK